MTAARAIDVVVIGAGHAGLAMSRVLAGHGVPHVVLERGEVANAWRRARWDSLRLLTPNWMTRLPGRAYDGPDPDGYMRADEVAAFIAGYAAAGAAPVHTHTTVTRVRADGDGWRVDTDRGAWRCRGLVLATGAFARPLLPAVAAALPPGVRQWTALDYRRPSQLDEGGVLVVGASATGVQLAHELRRSGRPVTLAVGEHVRLPRRYRGRDIQWWMLAAGLLDQRIEAADDPVRARAVPSPQLAGRADTIDLNALQHDGVQVVGRLVGVRDERPQHAGSLHNVCMLADLKMNRLLAALDAWAHERGLDAALPPPERFAPTAVPPARPAGRLGHEIRSVVWATGLRPDFGWLDLPAVAPDGTLRHDRGVVAPGLVVLGLPFLRQRKSSFIHGAEDDARELAAELLRHLAHGAPRARRA